eukprot:5666758-Prymnesium_polylepis.2
MGLGWRAGRSSAGWWGESGRDRAGGTGLARGGKRVTECRAVRLTTGFEGEIYGRAERDRGSMSGSGDGAWSCGARRSASGRPEGGAWAEELGADEGRLGVGRRCPLSRVPVLTAVKSADCDLGLGCG